jgi:hypothetical protein
MKRLLFASCALLLASCASSPTETPAIEGNDDGHPAPATTAKNGGPHLELDPVSTPLSNVSLLLMTPGYDHNALADLIEQKLHGSLFQMQGTRLAVAQVPTNADAVLGAAGMQTRYTRSVTPGEIGTPSTDETRFIEVFDSRYYGGSLGGKVITATRVVRAPNEPFESAPTTNATPLDTIYPTNTTPFASGTIVVSLLLPESNGNIDPSTENWTEDLILETYAKVQEALEALVKSEPNSRLRFILHFESAPSGRELPGTIDCDYESVLHLSYGSDDSAVTAALLAKVLGHAVTTDTLGNAQYEYLAKLKAQYNADGAYFIKIADDANFTASMRPHAIINGPSFDIDNTQGFEVFMHESGHIFGAVDEYCPDRCLPTTQPQGYLGMTNANATYHFGGDGVNGGVGENQPSLMMFNDSNAVGTYTRGAWGWLDSDGDGIIDVRDTLPSTAVTASLVSNNVLTLQGTITDVPAMPMSPFGITAPTSFNQITALEYRLADAGGTDWYSVPLTAGSVATVDVSLGAFPAGPHTIAVRGRNSVGNTDPVEHLVSFTVPPILMDTPPRLRVDANPTVGSTRTTFTIATTSADLDGGDSVQTRIDSNGDGTYDTTWGVKSTTVTFATPGVYHVAAQAKDQHGSIVTATTVVYVVDGNVAPAVTLSNVPTMQVGQVAPVVAFSGSAVDPDGDALQYNWVLDSAGDDDALHTETGFAAGNTSFAPTLTTPLALMSAAPILAVAGYGVPLQELALSPTTLVAAVGANGLVFYDITTPAAPVVLANLPLSIYADELALDGTRLYVQSGDAVAVVDVTNPSQPVELKQPAQRFTRTATNNTAVAIPDNSTTGATSAVFFPNNEVVSSIEVDVEVSHPAPAQLTFILYAKTLTASQSTIMRSLVKSAGGDNTYTFTNANTPALNDLTGFVASGEWDVIVTDTVAGSTGTIKKATVKLGTSTTAFPAITPGASRVDHLVGVLANHKLVVAGAGLQVIDATTPAQLKSVATLSGTDSYAGKLVGKTAVVLSAFTGATKSPQTHALYTVDLTTPTKPVVGRQDEEFGNYPGSLSIVGTTAYLTMSNGPSGPVPTKIINASRLATTLSGYSVGSFPGTAQLTSVVGDATTVWGVANGQLQSWNVSTPSAPRLVGSFSNAGAAIATVATNKILLYGAGNQLFGPAPAMYIDTTLTGNTVSRVYRVTLQAKDSQGAITSSSRTVSIVPYEHPPTLTAAVQSGSKAGDTFAIIATYADPDHASTWDSQAFVEGDFDGDGIYETGFNGGNYPAREFDYVFPAAGTYVVRFLVRDMYWVTNTTSLTVTVH